MKGAPQGISAVLPDTSIRLDSAAAVAEEVSAAARTAEGVAQRLEGITAYLRCIGRGLRCSVTIPLWNIRALQDEFRRTGHADLSGACSRMEYAVMALQLRPRVQPEELLVQVRSDLDLIRRRMDVSFTATPVSLPECSHCRAVSDSVYAERLPEISATTARGEIGNESDYGNQHL